MRMFNASLERFKKQCDSKVFLFMPNAFTEVPDHLAGHLYETLKDKGVFLVPDHLPDEKFQEEKRKALLAYLGITLRERIVNYLAYQDDQRKKGATLIPDARFDRAVRWQEELRKVLQQQAPIDEELSFLETKRLENTVLEVEEILEPSFTEEVVEPKKRGRPAKLEMEARA